MVNLPGRINLPFNFANEIGISTGRIGMKNFDMEFYIKRNEDTAKRLYGNRLDENRRVKGTNIWFDAYWRIHTN